MITGILGGGLALGGAVLVVYAWAMHAALGEETARSAGFATWMVGHLVLAAHMRSDRPLLRGGHRLHLVSLSSRLWAVVVTIGVALPSCFALQKRLVRSRQSGDLTPRSAQEASEGAGQPGAKPSNHPTRDGK